MTHRKDILIVRRYGEGSTPDHFLDLIHKMVPRTVEGPLIRHWAPLRRSESQDTKNNAVISSWILGGENLAAEYWVSNGNYLNHWRKNIKQPARWHRVKSNRKLETRRHLETAAGPCALLSACAQVFLNVPKTHIPTRSGLTGLQRTNDPGSYFTFIVHLGTRTTTGDRTRVSGNSPDTQRTNRPGYIGNSSS